MDPPDDASAPSSLSLSEFRALFVMEERLGEGAMGRVWRAVQVGLGRTVAIKVLHAGLTTDEETLKRFEREARILAGLSHPRVVRVFALGRVEGAPYLVMEYMAGGSLTRLMRGGKRLAPREALPIVRAIAQALECLHGHGVLHRDVKPENVMLTSTGEAKLGDLGLAKPADATMLTSTGLVVGTPRYMAPEGLLGNEPTAASDLYSLGLVAYELLTGTMPFEWDHGDLTGLVAAKVNATPQPLSRHVPDVDPSLAALIGRLVAPDARDRPTTAAEVLEGLEAVGRTVPSRRGVGTSPYTRVCKETPVRGAAPSPPAGSHPVRILRDALCLAIGAAAVALTWTGPRASDQGPIGAVRLSPGAGILEVSFGTRRPVEATVEVRGLAEGPGPPLSGSRRVATSAGPATGHRVWIEVPVEAAACEVRVDLGDGTAMGPWTVGMPRLVVGPVRIARGATQVALTAATSLPVRMSVHARPASHRGLALSAVEPTAATTHQVVMHGLDPREDYFVEPRILLPGGHSSNLPSILSRNPVGELVVLAREVEGLDLPKLVEELEIERPLGSRQPLSIAPVLDRLASIGWEGRRDALASVVGPLVARGALDRETGWQVLSSMEILERVDHLCELSGIGYRTGVSDVLGDAYRLSTRAPFTPRAVVRVPIATPVRVMPRSVAFALGLADIRIATEVRAVASMPDLDGFRQAFLRLEAIHFGSFGLEVVVGPGKHGATIVPPPATLRSARPLSLYRTLPVRLLATGSTRIRVRAVSVPGLPSAVMTLRNVHVTDVPANATELLALEIGLR